MPSVWWLAWYGAASVVSFVLYGLDKRAAVRGRRRTRERTLLTVDLAGGWPGGLAGQWAFRHKRATLSYMLRFGLIVHVHVAAWVAWFVWGQ